ncbi:winged helix-turn-helix transcriptional regulator [Aquicoccus porphyridii]|uniref:winged helix-turn-helix transcriptional regulator n=1 Tax=Aquicoccus porphyridii TaxID=1852029 RepID=UPI003514E9E4
MLRLRHRPISGPSGPLQTAHPLRPASRPAALWRNRRIAGEGRSGKPITPRILSRELKDMTEPGLLHRTEYPVVPRKVEYALAPRGKALLPILSEIVR